MIRLYVRLIFIGAVILMFTFFGTHHKVYGKCHTSPDGQICKLIGWVGNK
jgi:hypothetical protein